MCSSPVMIACWNTFTTFVPSDAETKKNGSLCFVGNAKLLSVTL